MIRDYGIAWFLRAGSTIGPQFIATGRAAYNAVINRTEDQQMLASIVRRRCGETISTRAVTNVTANIRVSTGKKGQTGIGNPRSY